MLKSKGKKAKSLDNNLALFSMTLPAMLKIFIFSYLPMFGIILAFKDLNYNQGIFGSPWVGFDNFEFFFKSESAWRITRNTLLMNGLFIVTGTIVYVLFAALLFFISKDKIRMKAYQMTMFFPYFLSWVVVSFLLNSLIGSSGVITHFLQKIGLDINFFLEAKYWPIILVIANIWKNLGYNSIIYFSILLGIDPALYEAAELDGASSRQILLKIQIPQLVPMIILNTLLAIGNIFRADFGMFYFLPGSENTFTLATTDVIDTFAFRALRDQGNLSMSAAVGVYQSIVGFILIMIANYTVKKYDSQSSLF